MDISVERERQQQRSTERLRELAMKNSRVARDDVERTRGALDPRDRVIDRTLIPERGMLERDRLPERPMMLDRPGLVDREPPPPKAGVPVGGRMLEREGRVIERDVHRDVVSHAVGRGGAPIDRLIGGLDNREREEERTPERIRQPDRDVVGSERVADVDLEREESLRELVSSYKSALAELTFNSKPIITNLTIIAGENSHAAKGITSTVCNHIMEVPKEQKLPSLYLLDSIVKNIGGDYIKYFAARLPEVFCYAYRQVDPSTNPAMQHLFRTWRGVFPPGPLRLIESELQISSAAPNVPSGGTPPARPVENPLPQAGHESSMPRPGHGIHVNPKYLEAQRQRLQQSGQAERVAPESNGTAAARVTEGSNLRENSKGWSDTQLKRPPIPSRRKREEYADPSFGGDASFDGDYDDYGTSNGPNSGRRSGSGRITEREGWEPGYFRDGDGEGFGLEEDRGSGARYGQRNGYDWRQPPRSTDIDGYGYNRGPGPGRGGPFRPGQASGDSMEGRGRGVRGNWVKAEEEEYAWEDMSPRLGPPPPAREDPRTGDRLSKDDWYSNESGRNIPVGETGRLKRTSQDAGFVDNSSWRRSGPGAPIEQAHPGSDRRSLKEYEERRSMQSVVGRESGIAPMDQVPGPARGPLSGPRPNAGWPSQGNSLRNLSPPARTRPEAPLLSVPTNNISPTARSSQNLLPLPRAGTPPTPSNGVGPPLHSGHFESRQPSRSNVGSFGGGSPTFNNLSQVTPASGISFQQRQQSHRHPPSQTQLAQQSGHQQIPPLASAQPQNQQLHHQLQHEQSNHLPGRHPMHMSAQLQSSQPLPQAPQGIALQQGPPSQTVPPLLQSGQQSLQQTLQHLSAQQGPALQSSSQVPGLQQAQQLLGLHQAQQVPGQQPLPQLNQPHTQQWQPVQLTAPVLPLISSQLAQSLQQLAQAQKAQQSQQSQPSAAQQPQPQPPISGLLSQSLQQFGQGQPSQQSKQSQGSVVATTVNQMTTFGGQPQRFPQPPLPPGPPPASTIVGSTSTTTSVAAGGALTTSISSLLSSLVAHGVIGAAGQNKPAPIAGNAAGPVGAPQPTPNPNFVPLGPLPSVSINMPSTTVSATPLSGTSALPSGATAQDAPPSPLKPKKEVLGVEFKQELLRERHEYVLEALYSDFPRQCKTCGLRFKVQDEHSKHMDWHVSRNRRQKSQKKVSRKWFVSAKEWLSGTSTAASEAAPSFFAEEPGVQEENTELVAVPADENQSACALCGELFEDFYSDETDEWMYKGAVYLNIPQGTSTEGLDSAALGPIVHMKCKTESAETAAVDSVDDDDEQVQPELQAADSVRMEVDGMGEDNIMPLLTDNFDMSEIKEEQEDLGSRRKRTRY
ncbi:unnamed protein product [Calypogeia fissa]